MAKDYDCDKILAYAEDAAWSALESMMLRKADLRTPADADVVKNCLKIVNMTAEDIPAKSAAKRGSYADGMTYDNGHSMARGRHLVRAHYSYADEGTGGTLSRMMDMATPQEQQILERLLRKADA